LIGHGADVELLSQNSARRCCLAAKIDLNELLAAFYLDNVQTAVAAGDEGVVTRDHRRAVNRPLCFELPNFRAVFTAQAVQRGVVRAKNDLITGKIGAGGDLTTRLEGPAFPAAFGIDTVKDAVFITDVDGSFKNAHRRLD